MEKFFDQSKSLPSNSPQTIIDKLHQEIKKVQLSQATEEPLSFNILQHPIIDSYLRVEDINSEQLLQLISAFETDEKKILLKALTFNNIQELLFKDNEADRELLKLLLQYHNEYIESKIETWIGQDNIFSKNLLTSVLALNWKEDPSLLNTYLPFIKDIPVEVAEELLADESKHEILLELGANFQALPVDISAKLGFDFVRLVRAWKMIKDQNKPSSSVSFDQGRAVYNLENRQPGSVKFLMDNYGICDFDRYPSTILLDQIKNHEISGKYGAIFFPRNDHNNAFGHDGGILEAIAANLPEVQIKILEVENKLDFAKKLVFLANKFGPMDYLIISGHGNGESIQFGDNYSPNGNSNRLDIKDIQNLRDDPDRSGKFLNSKSPIFLNSCQAGISNGIGQAIAEKLGTLVTAPDSNISLAWLDFIVQDDRLTFLPVYHQAQANSVYYVGKKGNFKL